MQITPIFTLLPNPFSAATEFQHGLQRDGTGSRHKATRLAGEITTEIR